MLRHRKSRKQFRRPLPIEQIDEYLPPRRRCARGSVPAELLRGVAVRTGTARDEWESARRRRLRLIDTPEALLGGVVARGRLPLAEDAAVEELPPRRLWSSGIAADWPAIAGGAVTPRRSRAHPDTLPVWYRCVLAARDVIESLSLAGIDADQIVTHKTPDHRGRTLPAIVVAPGPREQMTYSQGTNVRDDVLYPVVVAIYEAGNQDQELQVARGLRWRERIARAFRNQRLTGVEEIYTCAVEPVVYLDAQSWYSTQMHVQALTLRFYSREIRGIDA